MSKIHRKSPAFQFYPNDWLSSTHIQLMTPEEEGAYIRLLAYHWNSDPMGLPSDDEELSVLSRLGEKWVRGPSNKVRQCFFEKNGRLFNKRLLTEKQKQDKYQEHQRESGRIGSLKRWHGEPIARPDRVAIDSPMAKHSSSSSSSSSFKKEYILSVLSYLNEKTKSKFRNEKHIRARIEDGASVDDCKKVIDTKLKDPYFIEHPKYLNPVTLFRKDNFDNYLNELNKIPGDSRWKQ